MTYRAFRLVVIAVFVVVQSAVAQQSPRRDIPCKTPANAASCYWTHGRLLEANGNPSFRLWKIGTHRVLGIYSGPSVDRSGLDNEGPELPTNIQSIFDSNRGPVIYGDFDICPLDKEQSGTMQAACIETAKNVAVKDK